MEKDYSFKSSQVIEVDASSIELAPEEDTIRHKKGEQDLDLKSFMD